MLLANMLQTDNELILLQECWWWCYPTLSEGWGRGEILFSRATPQSWTGSKKWKYCHLLLFICPPVLSADFWLVKNLST